MTPVLFQDYINRGFALCRIPSGRKCPIDRQWQLNPIRDAGAFQASDAVGLLLGALSGGVLAIDLDFHAEDAEAWTEADALLPDTGLMAGRPGKLTGHRIYRLTDREWPDSVLPGTSSETRQAMDRGLLPRFPGTRHFSNGRGRGIDVLGAGSQIVIPPSLHPSGARRVWWGGGPGEPAAVAYADLMGAVDAVADRLGLARQRPAHRDDAPGPPDPAVLGTISEPERLRRLEGYLRTVAALEHGKGLGFHAQQWRIACVCVEFGVPFAAASPLYRAWNRTSRTPDADEANDATLANAYRSAVFGARLIDPADPVDLSGIVPDSVIPATTTAVELPAADPADPGPLPPDLLRVPGFIGEVMDHCLATAPYPNPAMAFCGALSLLAFLAGRKIREPGGLRTNLYLLGLAHSASGKDWPRKLNTRILHAIGLSDRLGDRFASGEGLQDALFVNPNMLFQTDEIDGLLQSVNKAQDARHEGIMGTLLTLYTSADSVVPMRRKAGQPTPGVIDQPCLSIFGTAIPNHYYEALSRRMLTNGLFARMIVVEGGKRGDGQDSEPMDPPAAIIDIARYWADYQPAPGNLDREHPTPTTVPLDEDAAKILSTCRREADQAYVAAEARDDAVATTVWGRVNEQARKLALIHAISTNHRAPRIDAAAAGWATRFMLHQTRRMLAMAQGHVAENPFHAECLKLTEKLRAAPERTLPHSVLLKRMKLDSQMFQKLVQTMQQAGDIEATVQRTPGRPGVYYRLIQGGTMGNQALVGGVKGGKKVKQEKEW